MHDTITDIEKQAQNYDPRPSDDPSKDPKIWYFAYGSNMAYDKFVGSRKIIPYDQVRLRLPGWQLTTEIPGMPYSEPAFASVKPLERMKAGHKLDDYVLDAGFEVHGVGYLITAAQFRQVIASEGGGIAYAPIRTSAIPVGDENERKVGRRCDVWTLKNLIGRKEPGRFSGRYMTLVLSGAAEARLPDAYLKNINEMGAYHPPTERWTKLGAMLFLMIWGPIMKFAEWITLSNIKPDGNTYGWIQGLVRFIVWSLWFTHDWVFAPVFGRGDGVDQELDNVAMTSAPGSNVTASRMSSLWIR